MTSSDDIARPGPVPDWLVVAADWSWRLLVIAAAVIVVLFAATFVSVVLVPVIVSVFACALLEPIRRRLIRWGASPVVASTVAFTVGVLLIATVIALAVSQTVSNFDELTSQFQRGIRRLGDSLSGPPFRVNTGRIEESLTDGIEHLKENPARVLSGAFSVLSTTGGLVAGGLLATITTLFFMTDRERIVRGVLSLVPSPSRAHAARAADAAWEVLVSYVRVTLTEAVATSAVIGTAAAIAGLPIAFALGGLVFLLGFIPIVGAILSGLVVVLITLVTQGATTAIVLAVVILVVQQLDANVLYPYLTSRNLSIHPLLSLLLVSAGGVAGGLFGAFVAVPTAAMIGAAFVAVRRGDLDSPGEEAEEPGSVLG